MTNRISLALTTAILSSVLTVLVFSCKDNNHLPQQQDTVAGTQVQLMASASTTMDTVPLDTAIMNVKHYLDSCDVLFHGAAPIQAYTIHASDMLMALGIDPDSVECQYTHARVYIGLDPAGNFKLYFTPVVGAHLSPKVNAGRDTILSDEHGHRYVMDLNAPCPNTCDNLSPFFNPQ